VVEPSLASTVLASSFAASLELAREGQIELHQHAAFAPLYLRKRTGSKTEAADMPPVQAGPGNGQR
jgi:segregation and condensation protein A